MRGHTREVWSCKEILFSEIFQTIIGWKEGELFPFVIIKYMHIVYICIHTYTPLFPSDRTARPSLDLINMFVLGT